MLGENKMKEKRIFIQVGVTIDLDHEDLEDFLTYLPEKLTGFVTNEDAVLEDELYDEDVKILDEKGGIFSASVGALLADTDHLVQEKTEGYTNIGVTGGGHIIGNCKKCNLHGVLIKEHKCKTKDIKTVKIELKNGDDPLHGTDWGFEEVNGMIELSEILPKDEIVPSNERKRTYFIPLENVSFVEVIKPIE